MASIDRLQISGIRSFDPNTNNRQEIRFHKPLTVILGKNGAGKTTIIESLLNACTGKMPPGAAGSEKASFIYDPKVVGESNVKGQIRLVFTSRNGDGMQIIRSFQVTQTKTSIKFQTLDSTVSVKNKTTDKIDSASCRCTDLDSMVPDHLGVSTAVLEHVIFCHQEDCNWPLGPPAEVKKKFDDIFASTRYVSAMDKLRDRSKHYRAEQKEKEALLLCYREHRDQARQLQTDIESKEEAVRLTKLRNKEIEPRLIQLRSALEALDSIAANVETLQRDAAIIGGRIEEKQNNLRRLKIPPPQETLVQLEQMLNDFETQLQRIQHELQTKASRADAAEAAANKANMDSHTARSQLQVFSAQEDIHKKNVSKLHKVISTITNEFVAGENEIDERAIVRIEETLAQRVNAAVAALAEAKRANQQQLKELTDKRETYHRGLDGDGKERELKEQQLLSIQQRVKSLQDTLPTITEHDVERLKREFASAKSQVDAARAARENGETGQQITAVQSELTRKNHRIAEVRRMLAEKHRGDSDAAKAQDVKRSMDRKEEQLQDKLTVEIIPMLQEVGRRPKALTLLAVTTAAEQFRQQKTQALSTVADEQREAECNLRSATDEYNRINDELMKSERDLKQKRSVCRSVLGSEENIGRFADILKQYDDEHIKKCREATSIEAMAQCYDSFVTAAKRDQMCVVCKRGLPGAALSDFIKLNEERQATTPQQLEKAKKDADSTAAELDRLKKLEPQVREVLALEEKIPQLRAQLTRLQETKANQESLLNGVLTSKVQLEKQLDQATRVWEAVRAATMIHDELTSLQREHAALQHQLAQQGGTGAEATVEQLQSEHDAITKELNMLNDKLQGLQRSMMANGSGAVELEQAVSRAQHNLMKAETDLERRVRDESALATLRSEAQGHQTRIADIAKRRSELQSKLQEVDVAIQHINANHDGKLMQLQQQQAAEETQQRNFAHHATAVKEFIGGTIPQQIRVARDTMKVAEKTAQQASAEARTLRHEVEDARRAIGEQHRNREGMRVRKEYKELEEGIHNDTKALQACRESLAKLQGARIKDIEELIGANASNEPPSKIKDAIRAKASELERVRAQNEGKKETLLQDIAHLKAQLDKEKYRDIGQRYTATFIKVQTLEMASQDIDKYHKALEKAVASYHQEKIAQINRIIAELWRTTYRGSDIDTVEICSEADGTDARRTFKYRVVMKRGDAQLDMRGRCSAGQKVLASVIIRMALSEAFCCDCGILALDEPTTNLDEDNARALAEALRDLIQARMNIKHFQLVVITHDEAFVRALGAKQRDNFYFVTKDREGAYSVIQERRYDELFA